MNRCREYVRALLLLACGFAYSSSAVACKIHLIMMGDSITQGVTLNANGVLGGTPFLPEGQEIQYSYGPHWKTMVSNNSECEPHAYNWGKASARSDERISTVGKAISHLNQRRRRGDISIAVILFGGNDAGQNVPTIQYQQNISLMAQEFSQNNVLPLLGTVTPRPRHSSSHRARVAEYRSVVRSIASSNGYQVADFYSRMTGSFGLYHSGDYRHINSWGYQVMARVVFDLVKDSLEQTEPNPSPSTITRNSQSSSQPVAPQAGVGSFGVPATNAPVTSTLGTNFPTVTTPSPESSTPAPFSFGRSQRNGTGWVIQCNPGSERRTNIRQCGGLRQNRR